MANLSNQTSEVAVKVAVRVRPLNNREKLHQHQPCVRLSSETNQLVIGKDKIFTFDYVLAPKTSQSDLYESCVHQLVQSIFDGYNSTVFAYGQTGSGKTHTISGSNQDYGIIPRAVEAMFEMIGSKQDQRDYLVKVNFIEIYKEELKDLLDSSEKDLHIREDESGNTIIYGANEVVCSSLEEVMTCFDSGTLLRHTGSTQMNEHSSRSHSVFTVSIEQRWTTDAKVNVRESAIYELKQQTNAQNSYYLGAKFHFVDLAGSERVHRTGNVGDRFKESIHINSGLLALGNVISALSSDNSAKKKNVHIPYRESKITRILKDSLGGNSNTLMICCISPSSCNLDESINALKYASRARYIRNKPIVNMDPEQQKFVEMQSEIQALREELSRQRTFISEANLATINDEEMIIIQDKLDQVQNERDMHKKLSKEAFNRFRQFDQLLNQNNLSMVKKLTDEWLHIFESSTNRSDFDVDDLSKQKICQLEQQLKQAHDDLKSDEEIFSDKENEINNLKEKISDLEQKLQFSNRYLEQSLNKEREQQELLLQLQLQLDNLIANKQDSDSPNTSGYKSLNVSNKSLNKIVNQRAKTAPVEESNKKLHVRPGAYSTPALSNSNLDRFMQNFRARSQLLTETLEENDCVLQNSHLKNGNFNSTFSVDDDEQVEHDHDSVQDNDQENDTEFNFVRKGTFKIDKSKQTPIKEKDKMKKNTSNTNNNKNSFNNNSNNNNKLRDMSINIKMKEELIKELVANSKITNRLNVQLKQKIELMEKEINQYKAEIGDLQRQSQTIGNLTSAKASDFDLKKKLEHAQNRIMELEANRNKANLEKKIFDMEIAYGKLKQQNDLLQKRIKDDTDKKLRLEKDYEKEQQRLKELETKSEKQQQILKKKTEDLAQAQRRLRSASQTTTASPDTEQKHWVEQEMEKILQEKRQIELFKEELIKREELIKKKECLIKEKDKLEDKKSKNLQESHLSLIKQRKFLDEKLNNGTELTAQEERRLIEIDEAIEAIEIAIEYENDSIREKQIKLKDSVYFDNPNQINENVLDKFSSLSSEESRILLKKFFVKIIDLKEQELKLKLDNNELEIQIEEQTRVVEQLKLAIKQNVSASTNGKSLDLKSKNEKIIKMLQQQLSDSKSREVLLEREIESYKEKILKLKQKYQNQNLESESSMAFLNSQIDSSNGVVNEDLKSSFKPVKMSRKDLRPLAQEEVIKRSLNRLQQQQQQSNVKSIDENV